MQKNKTLNYINDLLKNIPTQWIELTTHRLDIYNESLAKTEFLEKLNNLFKANNATSEALDNLPTAFDYIRLGHPLSSILEWAIANTLQIAPENVISFSSRTAPILAVLRKNLLDKKATRILVIGELPASFDTSILEKAYNYSFEIQNITKNSEIIAFEGTTILYTSKDDIYNFELTSNVDFFINAHTNLGSIIVTKDQSDYISEIQHVRRRETIAMTPANTLTVLQQMVGKASTTNNVELETAKESVHSSINKVTGTTIQPIVASSGLSIQYAILMGLIDFAFENYKDKAIKIVVPPNCYGGTNDQARRVAKCIEQVEIMDLPVDGDNDMVQSIEIVLDKIAKEDAVPFIIAEIPTNPRVEVPNLKALKDALSKERKTTNGGTAIDPVFILDQTFCPNVHFLGDHDILSTVRTISFASGSKFASGGKCTSGYCVGNKRTQSLMDKINLHMLICDNEATPLQYEILAKQMPSMNQRIAGAYQNTRNFVNYIQEVLPEAKINFVSEELAKQGFTPSVFSLDLPTKGNTDEEREAYKRALNLKLINKMITEIPNESKYCVSYGQLKGCYWTIPATSTQGTTKEDDKDYIARVALSPNMDLEKHKQVFADFVKSISE